MFEFSSALLGYVGPETILPLTSVLAAIGGVLAMFWNSIRRGCVWTFRKLCGKHALTTDEGIPSEEIDA